MSSGLTLVLLGLLGSGALAGLAFAMGFNADGKITDADEVVRHLIHFAPETKLAFVAISNTQKMALARSTDNRLYLLVSIGDKISVRLLTQNQLRVLGDGHVCIDVDDIGVPTLDFRTDQSNLEQTIGRIMEGDVI